MSTMLDSLVFEVIANARLSKAGDKEKAHISIRGPIEDFAFIDATATVIATDRTRVLLQLLQVGIEFLKEKLPPETLAEIEAQIPEAKENLRKPKKTKTRNIEVKTLP